MKSKSVLVEAIKEGVSESRFGLGYLSGEEVTCEYLGKKPTVTLEDNEVIVRKEYCEKLRARAESEAEAIAEAGPSAVAREEAIAGSKAGVTPREWKPPEVKRGQIVLLPAQEKAEEKAEAQGGIGEVHLRLTLGPGTGGLRDLLRTLNLLKTKFERVTIEIKAEEGAMTDMEYENLLETFKQLQIEVEELKKGRRD